MSYTLPAWADRPALTSPINTANLSLYSTAINDIDTRIVAANNLPGLAIGAMNVPVGLRAHSVPDVIATTFTSQTYRFFMPLSDPSVTTVLPKFGNWFQGGEIDPGWTMTIAAAVEMSDGTINPFTWNGGNHTFTFPAGVGVLVTPDSPRAIGTQISTTTRRSEAVSGFWMRTYVSAVATRTDTCGTTNGSATVTDVSIVAGDQGKAVFGTGIPVFAYVGTVTAGVSFVLSTSPTVQANTNATATNATVSLTVGPIIPANMGPLHTGDAATTVTGADLTFTGSGSVSGGSATYMYGPALLLGRSVLRKPIVAHISDSILDGYGEDSNSQYWGPVARACTALGFPYVKAAKGGERALDWTTMQTIRYRLTMIEGCTHAIVQLGVNDQLLANSGGVTTLQNRLTSIGNLLVGLGIKPYLSTVAPWTTSTDNWVTTVNQTPAASSQPTQLASFNSWARAVPSPYLGCFDMAQYCETSITPDSGIWPANGTADGIHPSSALMVGSISTAMNTFMSGWTV